MSAIGQSWDDFLRRKCPAFGGKADMGIGTSMSAYDPSWLTKITFRRCYGPPNIFDGILRRFAAMHSRARRLSVDDPAAYFNDDLGDIFQKVRHCRTRMAK